jgi:predicted TIM-barrel fold metal-dependent hydrolase
MAVDTPTATRPSVPEFEGLAVFDCDVHPILPTKIGPYLPKQWRDYLELVGRRSMPTLGSMRPAARPHASRLDTIPPGGSVPCSDPEFAALQVFEELGIGASILNEVAPFSGNAPRELDVALARAVNDCIADQWLPSDPRWLSSIKVPADQPERAAEEIVRCRQLSDRFVQVMPEAHTDRPLGNPKFWPIYEAAVEYGLPVAFHASASKHRVTSGIGDHQLYFELRTSSSDIFGQPLAASMIFEGVFDRFPSLKIVLIELDWAWVVPMMWRLDATWRVMRDEVPHLLRKPSEYLRENFWFSSQPIPEPEHAEQLHELYAQWERHGLADRLLFASDYPHWDMDAPTEALPLTMPRETKRKIFSQNAVAVYGLDLEQTPLR